MPVHINITDRATPLLLRVRGAVQGGRLANAMGRGASNEVQGHLFRLNAERPNRLGGRRTNFYAQAARSTHYTAEPGAITVSVSHVGIRQRFEGGRIRPVTKKYLTIPATAEAHGKRAGEFPDLQFAILGGRPCLVRARQTRLKLGGRRKDGSRAIRGVLSTTGTEVLYWLVREVNQKPDPSVLPSKDVIARSAIAAGEAFLGTLKGGTGAH